jgi:DNA-binding NtrC family response regulator
MARRKTALGTPLITVLLVEADVIVRFAIAEYLRTCELAVIEAAQAKDAKEILVAGPEVHVLMSDAQLAEGGAGFALAQWVRRHRPSIEVILTASTLAKAQMAAQFAARIPHCSPPSDAVGLETKLNAMLAERKRRLRKPPKTAPARRKRIS